MRRIREILKLKHEAGLSGRAIACAIGVSNSTVAGVFARCELAGLSWPLPEQITDAELEGRLCREHYEPVADLWGTNARSCPFAYFGALDDRRSLLGEVDLAMVGVVKNPGGRSRRRLAGALAWRPRRCRSSRTSPEPVSNRP